VPNDSSPLQVAGPSAPEGRLPSGLIAGTGHLGRLLLTAHEAAQALAISERTLWGLTRRGAIPCVRLGRAVRYDLADLHSFIAEKKCNGRPR
jgi:excisionase family DNA binding protein